MPAGVLVAPVMPGITDTPQGLEAVVRATAEAGGRHVFANPLFLKPCSASIFLPFLEAEFPQLVADYRQRYDGRSFVSANYRKSITVLMARLRQKYGFTVDEDHKSRLDREKNGRCERANSKTEIRPPAQMRLF